MTDSKKSYKPFTITNGKAFINKWNSHPNNDDDTLYFVNLGMITGRLGKGDKAKSQIQYLDLLVGNALKPLAKKASETGVNPFEDISVGVEIHNLHIMGVMSDNKETVYLNSRGVLNAISVQYD